VPASTTKHGAPIAAPADIVRTGGYTLDPARPRAGQQAETIAKHGSRMRIHAEAEAMQSAQAIDATARRSQPVLLQRKCACGAGASGLTGECAECSKMVGLQTKLRINEPGDVYEQEADRVAEQVLAKPACPHVSGVQRFSGQSSGQTGAAPASVGRALASPGRPLEPALRQDMESRFGHDFSTVRVHSDAAADQSARDVNAHAYTVGHNIAFGAGRYAPATHGGRRLIAHELAHVMQQSRVQGGVVQRQPAGNTDATYERLVKQGKWCRDRGSEAFSRLRCAERSRRRGATRRQTGLFQQGAGKFVGTADDISPVRQNKDGTCDIPVKITDPPHPFTQRGRRGLGHGIADIAPQDPDLVGKWYGRISGVAMGIALPKGTDSDLASWAIPSILGFLAGELGERGLPRLNSLARKHGFVPTMSLGFGSNVGVGLAVGLEKRDRPLPRVPINTYLTFSLDSSLAVGKEAGETSTLLAKVGVRIDPGKQGGLFAVGSVGAGLAAAGDVSGAVSAELGVGFRATDFLDLQVVRETVSGEAGGDTYWLTLKLVAPQRVLKRRR
jgi:hypothetical protein